MGWVKEQDSSDTWKKEQITIIYLADENGNLIKDESGNWILIEATPLWLKEQSGTSTWKLEQTVPQWKQKWGLFPWGMPAWMTDWLKEQMTVLYLLDEFGNLILDENGEKILIETTLQWHKETESS